MFVLLRVHRIWLPLVAALYDKFTEGVVLMIKKSLKILLKYPFGKLRESDLKKEIHINRALRVIKGHTYVEIGVESGKCFRQIIAPRKIGIDPSPINSGYELTTNELFFEMTSDEFFTNYAEAVFGTQAVDVAFVDGDHEFSQALRDILNLEKFMSPQGVIFIHDCNPPTRNHAEMNDDIEWTGDVWKISCYLTTYRPDLNFFTLNCDWGLGVLTGFRSSSGSELPSSDILKTFKELDYSLLEQKRKKILRLRPASYSRLFLYFVHPHHLKQTNE